MNEMQIKAVMSDSNRILVLAGAGTGKTTTMLARISRLVESGISPSEILVLTFTNSAACDMKDRYLRDHKDEKAPQFCTFHSFCYQLLAKDSKVRQQLQYVQLPSVAKESDIERIKTTCIQQCGIKLSMAKLNGKIPITQKEKFQFDIFWKQYDKMLRQNNLITFDIMCYEVGDLFVKQNPIVQKYLDKFKYIFVDEFQDTDHKQWDFVSAFKQSNIFVVGDVKQELYAFREADPEIIKGLSANPDWETIKLSENYRSTKQICEFANHIHDSIFKGKSYNLEINGQTDGEPIEKMTEFNPRSGEIVMELNSALISNKSVAVLCRTNSEVKYILMELKNRDVPCRTNSDQDSFRDIVKSAINPKYAVEWLAGKMNQDEYGTYLKMCAIDPEYETYEKFSSTYSDKFKTSIDFINGTIDILKSDDFAINKLVRIFSLYKLRMPKVKDSINSTEDITSFLTTYFEDRHDDSGVYVGTIHSVKGLEYDVVHLTGVNGDHFRLISEDDLNCFYVGVTRAREKLYIYYG